MLIYSCPQCLWLPCFVAEYAIQHIILSEKGSREMQQGAAERGLQPGSEQHKQHKMFISPVFLDCRGINLVVQLCSFAVFFFPV